MLQVGYSRPRSDGHLHQAFQLDRHGQNAARIGGHVACAVRLNLIDCARLQWKRPSLQSQQNPAAAVQKHVETPRVVPENTDVHRRGRFQRRGDRLDDGRFVLAEVQLRAHARLVNGGYEIVRHGFAPSVELVDCVQPAISMPAVHA